MHSTPDEQSRLVESRSDGSGGLAAEISNRVVGLLKEYTGRGPTKARTYLHERVVICVLEDTLTRGEQQLAEHGEEAQALENRRAFQRLIRSEARAAVEELTGRRVVAFLSDNALDPDIAVEAFVLELQPASSEAIDG